MRKFLSTLGVVAALLLTACTSAPAGSSGRSGDGHGTSKAAGPACVSLGSPATSGKQLPDVSLACLNGAGKVQLDGAPGKPMIVNFWASWCGPCRQEMPLLQDLYSRAGQSVLVLGVLSSDSKSAGASFAADEGVSFPNLHDQSGSAVAKLGVPGLPATVFVTADGTIAYQHPGPFTSAAGLDDAVKSHLGVSIG